MNEFFIPAQGLITKLTPPDSGDGLSQKDMNQVLESARNVDVLNYIREVSVDIEMSAIVKFIVSGGTNKLKERLEAASLEKQKTMNLVSEKRIQELDKKRVRSEKNNKIRPGLR